MRGEGTRNLKVNGEIRKFELLWPLLTHHPKTWKKLQAKCLTNSHLTHISFLIAN